MSLKMRLSLKLTTRDALAYRRKLCAPYVGELERPWLSILAWGSGYFGAINRPGTRLLTKFTHLPLL